jgi:hypothetical protein
MLSASTLQAITFNLQNCASCYGAVFEVTATQSAAQVLGNFWHIAWTMDLSAVNSANVTNLSAIAIQVAGGSGVENFPETPINPTSYSLTKVGPGGGVITHDGWTLYKDAGVSSAANCDASGNPQGFLCLAYADATGSPLKTGGVYIWEFDIDLVNGVTPGLAAGVIPIRGNWDPANGKLLSDVARVPEGVAGELPILLSGLVSLIIWRKRASFRALVG